MVILRNGLDHEDDDDEGVDDDQESDSDSGLGGSVPPCSVTFVGANVSTGKSSMRSKSRDKKVSHYYFKKIQIKMKSENIRSRTRTLALIPYDCLKSHRILRKRMGAVAAGAPPRWPLPA